jgi:hypothetical protein
MCFICITYCTATYCPLMYSTAHFWHVCYGFARLYSACETGTNVHYIAFYILSSYYLFRIIFSPSGRVHYVTCIGDRYMLQKLYQSKHILYQPVWLRALCNPVLGDRYMLQNLYKSRTHIVSAHLAVCIMWPVLGKRYMLQNLYRTHIISLMIMIACNVHIGVILYQPIWLCALCDLYWETGTCCKTYIEHILYHLWLYDCM